MITSASVTLTLTSTGSSYNLSSAVLSVTQATKSIGVSYSIPVSVSVSIPTSSSGNPGYQLGKKITLHSNLYVIQNPSTGTCYTTGSNLSTISMFFGLNQIFSCVGSSSCSNNFYIDTILQSSWSIQKYALNSTDNITVTGTGKSFNTSCNSERIILNIIYSQDGWELDPQYYITGASMTTVSSPENTTTNRYFQINWIYADPSTVSTPPSNTFYTYFSYLWTPLK